jgi:hypothetical protein
MDNKINELLTFLHTNPNKAETELFLQYNNELIYKYNNDAKYINLNKKYNIIIVDDSNSSLKLMNNLFKSYPQIDNILLACNGFDALNQILNSKFRNSKFKI